MNKRAFSFSLMGLLMVSGLVLAQSREEKDLSAATSPLMMSGRGSGRASEDQKQAAEKKSDATASNRRAQEEGDPSASVPRNDASRGAFGNSAMQPAAPSSQQGGRPTRGQLGQQTRDAIRTTAELDVALQAHQEMLAAQQRFAQAEGSLANVQRPLQQQEAGNGSSDEIVLEEKENSDEDSKSDDILITREGATEAENDFCTAVAKQMKRYERANRLIRGNDEYSTIRKNSYLMMIDAAQLIRGGSNPLDKEAAWDEAVSNITEAEGGLLIDSWRVALAKSHYLEEVAKNDDPELINYRKEVARMAQLAFDYRNKACGDEWLIIAANIADFACRHMEDVAASKSDENLQNIIDVVLLERGGKYRSYKQEAACLVEQAAALYEKVSATWKEDPGLCQAKIAKGYTMAAQLTKDASDCWDAASNAIQRGESRYAAKFSQAAEEKSEIAQEIEKNVSEWESVKITNRIGFAKKLAEEAADYPKSWLYWWGWH